MPTLAHLQLDGVAQLSSLGFQDFGGSQLGGELVQCRLQLRLLCFLLLSVTRLRLPVGSLLLRCSQQGQKWVCRARSLYSADIRHTFKVKYRDSAHPWCRAGQTTQVAHSTCSPPLRVRFLRAGPVSCSHVHTCFQTRVHQWPALFNLRRPRCPSLRSHDLRCQPHCQMPAEVAQAVGFQTWA